jgi:TPR repeat protein
VSTPLEQEKSLRYAEKYLRMAGMYEDEIGVPQNFSESFTLYQKAAGLSALSTHPKTDTASTPLDFQSLFPPEGVNQALMRRVAFFPKERVVSRVNSMKIAWSQYMHPEQLFAASRDFSLRVPQCGACAMYAEKKHSGGGCYGDAAETACWKKEPHCADTFEDDAYHIRENRRTFQAAQI